jgi:hypothetical protein
MGSDNGSFGKPNSRGLLAAVFTAGMLAGVILTFTASSMLVDEEEAGTRQGLGRRGEPASFSSQGTSESARVPEHAPGASTASHLRCDLLLEKATLMYVEDIPCVRTERKEEE